MCVCVVCVCVCVCMSDRQQVESSKDPIFKTLMANASTDDIKRAGECCYAAHTSRGPTGALL
jgi:hypothetical protein